MCPGLDSNSSAPVQEMVNGANLQCHTQPIDRSGAVSRRNVTLIFVPTQPLQGFRSFSAVLFYFYIKRIDDGDVDGELDPQNVPMTSLSC